MILKALYDYYNRCGDLAPEGMEYKEITFLLVIDKAGELQRIERRGEGKNGQMFLVMKGVRSGITPKPYLFWDNVEYVLNYTKAHEKFQTECDETERTKLQKEIAKSQQKNLALIDKYKAIAEQFPEEEEFQAVCAFYENGGLEKVRADVLWSDIVKKPTANVSFLLEGNTKIIAENPCLRTLSEKPVEDSCNTGNAICLVTGEGCDPVSSTTPTAIAGGQSTGRLVAFQIKSGYDSYGKSQGLNAPISPNAEAAYTTALNRLLGKGSRNKFMLSSRTFTFWASSNSEASLQAEKGLSNLFSFTDVEEDNPNAKIEEVRKVFQAILSGKLKTNKDDRFYILGLAPNSARIAVVYWAETSLQEFAEKIEQHFVDMELIDTRNLRKPYMGLRDMLSAVTLSGKQSDATPNLPEAIAKSIFQGMPYPYTLFASCIRRIRAESGDVRISRVAIIKAYLNRLPDSNNQKINIMLDKENKNQGYLCGRLFAVLDKIQGDANGIHSIRERYMNAASTTPVAVFATILNLSTHHSKNLSKESSRIFYEKLKQEIVDKIYSEGFPAHLSLQDQGRFFVGYYQQRADLFTSNTTEENTENS